MSKSVRWSTVTVYEFGVAIGGSAVPKRGGPAIGLAKTPEFVWSTRVEHVDASDSESESSSEGDDELKPSAAQGAASTAPATGNDRRQRLARRRRVRWLKPLERVTMLEEAGCSERRIYRTMMESSEIAMSRRLCISVQRSVRVEEGIEVGSARGVRRFTPEERVRLLQSDGMILRFSRETNIILASRRRTLVEDADVAAQKKQAAKKRKAEMLERSSCAPAYLSQRPRMIPASYV